MPVGQLIPDPSHIFNFTFPTALQNLTTINCNACNIYQLSNYLDLSVEIKPMRKKRLQIQFKSKKIVISISLANTLPCKWLISFGSCDEFFWFY